MVSPDDRSPEALIDRLRTVVDPEYVSAWLDAPNPAFGGRRPSDLVAAGDHAPLWEMIHRLESGEPY